MAGDREGREYRRSGFHGPPDGGTRRDEPLGYRHDEHSRDRGAALFRRPSFDQGFNLPMGRPGSHYMPQRYSPDRARPYSPDRAPGRYASDRHLSPPPYRREDPFGRSRYDREPPPPPPPPPPREHLRDGAWSSHHDRRGSSGARSRESSPLLHYGTADDLHHSMPLRPFDRPRRLNDRASADGEAVSPTVAAAAAAIASRGGAGRNSQPAADDHRPFGGSLGSHGSRSRVHEDAAGNMTRKEGAGAYDANTAPAHRDAKLTSPAFASTQGSGRQSAWDPKPVVSLGLVASLKEAATKQAGTSTGSNSSSYRHHHSSSGAGAGSGLPPPPPPPQGVFSNLGSAGTPVALDNAHADQRPGYRGSTGGFDRSRLPPPPLSLPPHLQPQQAVPVTPKDEPVQKPASSLTRTPSTAGMPITCLTPSSTAPSAGLLAPRSSGPDAVLTAADTKAVQQTSHSMDMVNSTGAGADSIPAVSSQMPVVPSSTPQPAGTGLPSGGRWSSTPAAAPMVSSGPLARLSAWDAPSRDFKPTVSLSGTSSVWDGPKADNKPASTALAAQASPTGSMPTSPSPPAEKQLSDAGVVAASLPTQQEQQAVAADNAVLPAQDTATTAHTTISSSATGLVVITSRLGTGVLPEVKEDPAFGAQSTQTAPCTPTVAADMADTAAGAMTTAAPAAAATLAPIKPVPSAVASSSALGLHGVGHGHGSALTVSFPPSHGSAAVATGQASNPAAGPLDKANTILSTIASTVSLPAKAAAAAAAAGASAQQQQQQQGRSRRFGMGISRRGSSVAKGVKDGDVDSAEKAAKDADGGDGQGSLEEDLAHAADQAVAAAAGALAPRQVSGDGTATAAAGGRRLSLSGAAEMDMMDVDAPAADISSAVSPPQQLQASTFLQPSALPADMPLAELKPIAVMQRAGSADVHMQDAGASPTQPTPYPVGVLLAPVEPPVSPPSVSEVQRVEHTAEPDSSAQGSGEATASLNLAAVGTAAQPPLRAPPAVAAVGSDLLSSPMQDQLHNLAEPRETASMMEVEQPNASDAAPAAPAMDIQHPVPQQSISLPTAAEITAQLEVVEGQIGEVEVLLQQLPEEQAQVEASLVEIEAKLAALDQVLLEDRSSELSQPPSSATSSSSSSSSSSEEADGEGLEVGMDENGGHASSTAPSLNSNSQGAKAPSVPAVHIITAALEVEVKPAVAEAAAPSECTSESESQEPSRPTAFGRRRGRGRGGRGRGRGRGAAAARHQQLLQQQAAVHQQAEQEGDEASDSSHMDVNPAYPSKNEVVSFMQLSSRQTEKLLLEGGRQVARQSHDLVLALLPPPMAAQVRASLEPGGAPFQPVVTEPTKLASWKANNAAFEAAKAGMLQYLRERQQLLAAKQAALEQRYEQHLTAFKAELAAIKKERPPLTPGLTPLSARSGSSRHLGSVGGAAMASFGVVRSDYEEQIILENLQAEELLKTMSVLPQQELDPWYKRWQGFDDRNGIRPDPEQELAEGLILGHWSEPERKAFMELFLQFPKDFTRISQHLPGRSTGDCVAFFYKHQKLDEFANVRRKQQLKKRKMNCDAKRHMMMMISPMMARARGFHLPMGEGGAGHPAYPPPGVRAVLPPLPQSAPPATSSGRVGRGRGRGGGRNQGGSRAAGGYEGSNNTAAQMQAVPGVIGMGIPHTLTAVPPAHIPPVQYSLYRGVSGSDDVAGSASLLAPPPPSLQPSDSQNELVAAPPPPPVAGLDGRFSTGSASSDSAFVQAVRLHGRDFRTISRQLGMRSESTAKQFYYKHRHRLDLDSALEHFNRTAETPTSGQAAADRGNDHLMDSGPVLPSITTALNSPQMSASISIGPTVSGVGLGQSTPGSFSNLSMGFNLPGAPKGILPPFSLPPVSSGTPTDAANGMAVPQVAPPLDVVGIGLHGPAGEGGSTGAAAMEDGSKETVTAPHAATAQQSTGGLGKRPSGGRSTGRAQHNTQQVDSASQLLAQLQRDVLGTTPMGSVPLFSSQLQQQQASDSAQPATAASSTAALAAASTPALMHATSAAAMASSAVSVTHAHNLQAFMNQLNSFQTHNRAGATMVHGGLLTTTGNTTHVSLPQYLQLLNPQGSMQQHAAGIPLQAVTALPMTGSGPQQGLYLVSGGGLIAAPGMQTAGAVTGQNQAANQLMQALQLLYRQPQQQPQQHQPVQLQVSQLLLNPTSAATQLHVQAAQPLQQQQSTFQLGALLTSLQNQAAVPAAPATPEMCQQQHEQAMPAAATAATTAATALPANTVQASAEGTDAGQQQGRPGSARASVSGSGSRGADSADAGTAGSAGAGKVEGLKGAGPQARGRSREGETSGDAGGQDMHDGRSSKKPRTQENTAVSGQEDACDGPPAAKLQAQRNSNASELSNPISQHQPMPQRSSNTGEFVSSEQQPIQQQQQQPQPDQLHPYAGWFQQQQQQQLPFDTTLPDGLAGLLAAQQQQQQQLNVLSTGNGGLVSGPPLAAAAAAAVGGPVVAMPGAPTAATPHTGQLGISNQQGSQLLLSLQQQANEANIAAIGLPATGGSVMSAPTLLLQQLTMPRQSTPSRPVLHVQPQLDGSAVLLSMLNGSTGRAQQAMLPNTLGLPMELRGHSLSPAPLLLSANGQLLTHAGNMVSLGAGAQELAQPASTASMGDVQQVIGVLDALDKAAAAPGGVNAALLEELKAGGGTCATGLQGNSWPGAGGTATAALGVNQGNGLPLALSPAPGSQPNLLLLPMPHNSGNQMFVGGRSSQLGNNQHDMHGMLPAASPQGHPGQLPVDTASMPQAVLQLLAQQAGVTPQPMWRDATMSDQQGEASTAVDGGRQQHMQTDMHGSRRGSRQPSPSPQPGYDANGVVRTADGQLHTVHQAVSAAMDAARTLQHANASVQMVLVPASMDNSQLQLQELQSQLQGQQQQLLASTADGLSGSWKMVAGQAATQPDAVQLPPETSAAHGHAHTSEQAPGQAAASPKPAGSPAQA